MTATWEITDLRFSSQEKRELSITAKRTDGELSRVYVVQPFAVEDGETIIQAADRLVVQLHAMKDTDKTWDDPPLTEDMFPSARNVLKTKLEAAE